MSYKILTSEELNRVLEKTSPHSFKFNIARMHSIYKLPTNDSPTLDVGEDPVKRLDGFFKTIYDEVLEYNARDSKNPEKPSIREKLLAYQAMNASTHTLDEIEDARQEVLTDIADWLSDLTVYIRSEGMKFGLPLEDTLDAVMGSNFTKVGPGEPKYDVNGKVQKDLAYFIPPEPAIKTIMWGVKPS